MSTFKLIIAFLNTVLFAPMYNFFPSVGALIIIFLAKVAYGWKGAAASFIAMCLYNGTITGIEKRKNLAYLKSLKDFKFTWK